MYAPALLTGRSLPPRTLCLTYDDGPGATSGQDPGPRTLPLATYLADEGIRATFFMVGRHVEVMPDAPAAVRARGHLVGNHSWSHPPLAQTLSQGGDVVAELRWTDALLAHPTDEPVYVRPPYGDWSSAVASALDAVPDVCTDRVGPVGWDIDSGDWMLWRQRSSPEEAAAAHLSAIEAVGRGIVLMHDSTADSEDIRQGNASYATARLLVPQLRRLGYTFVGLDEVRLH